MLLEVAYSDKDHSELADYKPKQGTFLGFDVAILAGNFESLVMYWIVKERWYAGIEKKPEYPFWELIKSYFKPRLTDSGLLRSAEDALLLTRIEKVVASFFEKDWHEPPSTPCCISLVEDFPKTGNLNQWPGFIDPDRFRK